MSKNTTYTLHASHIGREVSHSSVRSVHSLRVRIIKDGVWFRAEVSPSIDGEAYKKESILLGREGEGVCPEDAVRSHYCGKGSWGEAFLIAQLLHDA